jgi:hypothetical protein
MLGTYCGIAVAISNMQPFAVMACAMHMYAAAEIFVILQTPLLEWMHWVLVYVACVSSFQKMRYTYF